MFKFRHHSLVAVAAVCVMIAGVSSAFGTTATQSNTVTVPSVLTVTAPAAGTLTHDGNDTNQALAPADWTVASNGASGAAISFEVIAPFVGPMDYKRDVKLDLTVSTSDTGSGWETSVATAQTNGTTSSATVTAASTAAGNASLTLGVTMLNSDYSTMAAGSYTTTVTATLSAN